MSKHISAGIEPLKTSIRIWWKIDGKRDRDTLHDTPPTPNNLKEAQAIADMIVQQLRMGIFNRTQIFPHSKKRTELYFAHYIQLFKINEQHNVSPITWQTYLSKIDNHIAPYWHTKRVEKIDAEQVEYWVHHVLQKKLSPKTIRDIVMLFRGCWSYWARKNKDTNDPTQYIKLSNKDSDDIDPFSKAEIYTIITSETDPFYKRLWTVMLWSGLSSHEFLPLAAEDIDFANQCIFVRRGFVKGLHRVTKNRRRKRQIPMLPIVAQSLKEHIESINRSSQKISVLERDNNTVKHYQLTWLWYCNSSKTHFNHTQLSRKWRSHLEKCNIRYRPMNNCRHTYASQVLSTGAVSAEWLANQLGHTSTEMIHKHYGKFIPKDSQHIIQRLSQAITINS